MLLILLHPKKLQFQTAKLQGISHTSIIWGHLKRWESLWHTLEDTDFCLDASQIKSAAKADLRTSLLKVDVNAIHQGNNPQGSQGSQGTR